MTLTLLAVGAIAAAAYVNWTIHTRAAAEVQAAVAFDRTHGVAMKDAYDLRSAQQAYVAAGQNERFWFDRVTVATESLRAALAALRSATTSQAALAALESAGAAIEDFEQIDRRARKYAADGQRLLASDLIFSDGLEATGRIIAALEGSAGADTTARGTVAAETARQQTLAAGGAGVVAIVALLLLTPLAAAPAAPIQESRLAPTVAAETNQEIELGPVLDEGLVEALRSTTAPVAPAIEFAPPPQPAELQTLAAVCTDLARLSDTRLLPEILERTASALDASGLVVWIADPDGKELLPIAAHGYPDSVLARMGSLKADDENATAAAFRTGLLQTVSAAPGSNGAIAVPLLAPGGCRGVMSAEVRNDAEKQPARLAAASIVAAQLATLVGPSAARAQERGVAAVGGLDV
ncbi:MAG: GAF domain-containing protein [Vicinamibacterales bacterium]